MCAVALALLAVLEVGTSLATASAVSPWPSAAPTFSAALSALSAGLMLVFAAAVLVLRHAGSAAQRAQWRPTSGGLLVAAASLIHLAAFAHLLASFVIPSGAAATAAFIQLGGAAFLLGGVALLLLALIQVVEAAGGISTWRNHVRGQLAGLALLAFALALLVASGEAVPLAQLFDASLAVQIFAGCVAALACLVGTWVILGLQGMRKDLVLRPLDPHALERTIHPRHPQPPHS